jgi:hypothetical protein
MFLKTGLRKNFQSSLNILFSHAFLVENVIFTFFFFFFFLNVRENLCAKDMSV